ncbi:four helix bundle protein [Caulifigura coniformis]|uniref:four helix bundle protein n=1 Tax=Caulifigura coniformis TaxID=2527983 RepID=UPI0018D23B80|nr:four helix bundle protein [Caulifigura coniformis]
MTKSHRDLLVWQKAMTLVTGCYRITDRFPDRERFGLSSQLRRGAVSVPSNIAEGNARRSKLAYVNHLSIAAGSLAEMETQIQIALNSGDVNEGDSEDVFSQIEEVRRMTAGLIRSLEASEQPRHFE